MSPPRAGALVLALAALAGCDETHFQSPPAVAMQACDPHFVGTWLLTDTGSASPSCDDHELCEILIVGENCSSWHLIEGKNEASDEDRRMEQSVHVAFADLHGRKLVSVGADLEATDHVRVQRHWQRFYTVFRYELSGDTIRLYAVDSARVARLIEAKTVAGETEKKMKWSREDSRGRIGATTLTNYVVGNARAMQRVVMLPGVFADPAVVILKRVASADIVKPSPTVPSP